MRKHPIRRVLLSSAATVSGVVLLLALKSPTLPGAESAQSAAPPPAAGAPADPGAGPGTAGEAGETGETGGGAAGGTAGGQAGGAAGGQQARTVDGAAVQTQYGTVQARITVAAGRVTEASAAKAPSGNPRSDGLTATAVPKLGQQAVAAQSADIDTVSGATYTSEGYKKSLQSALDQAGLAGGSGATGG